MNQILLWLTTHTALVTLISVISVLLLAMTILATPWLVSRLPSDYLLHKPTPPSVPSLGGALLKLLRLILGLILACLGLVMMITPGPGMVLLLLGISVAEFPGKHRLMFHIATRPPVFDSLNWMRKRHHKPPFEHPQATLTS